nr:leptin receptor gene-related protein [Haliclona caerulea]
MAITCNRTVVMLVVMALTAALGVVLLFVGSAIDFHIGQNYKGNWWGLLVLIFYLLSPIPLGLARRCTSQEVMSAENLSIFTDICYFLSACIVVSGFGLPFVLARRHVIQAAAGALIAGANIFVFGTIYSFFALFGRETDEWEMTPY